MQVEWCASLFLPYFFPFLLCTYYSTYARLHVCVRVLVQWTPLIRRTVKKKKNNDLPIARSSADAVNTVQFCCSQECSHMRAESAVPTSPFSLPFPPNLLINGHIYE